MPEHTQIATCSYCGTRAMLRLRALPGHHELACTSCGAPIGKMKPLKREKLRRVEPAAPVHKHKSKTERKKIKRSKSRGWLYYAKELFDEIEDIFD